MVKHLIRIAGILVVTLGWLYLEAKILEYADALKLPDTAAWLYLPTMLLILFIMGMAMVLWGSLCFLIVNPGLPDGGQDVESHE